MPKKAITFNEQIITREIIEAELIVDTCTGIIIRRSSGCVAGSLDSSGHRQVRVQGRLTMAHRIVWFMHYGRWPKGILDHKNTFGDDNRIENLRPADPSKNTCNSRVRRDNQVGLKGVSPHVSGKYQVTAQGKYLGLVNTPEEGAILYAEYAKKNYGEFARLT